MKKSLLLVGAFLAVTAMAQAKEIVPAPVVVEETPVQIVEKEVIVYRDREPEGFRPNGYVDLQYRYYGEAEELNYKNNDVNNNYGRTQLLGKINMTEKQSLEYRVRSYNDWNSATNKDNRGEKGTQTRLRYFYDHGNLGDSKVDLISRLEYKKDTDDVQSLEYQARFNIADYLFNNDFIKTTSFTFAPKYKYKWSSNTDNYENILGLDLFTMNQLPLGFSFEFNLYGDQHFYGERKATGVTDTVKNNTSLTMEAYLYNTTNLYANDDVSVDFYFEGGFDPYKWNSEKIQRTLKVGAPDKIDAANYNYYHNSYQVYAYPQLIANYKITPNLNVYTSLGAEYRNWAYTSEKSAKDWRWQPTAVVGFRTTF
ncbi:hypothetical protein [uncultured Fusobacterium sp.]|uniref:major outer membrane protein FomA n=1 Tax=uncultured Fusobacterium sp. TaxID=159267 RepID=UPI0025CC0EE1|nr:hypothetical protein [uncultured Fusobacterium sp.]